MSEFCMGMNIFRTHYEPAARVSGNEMSNNEQYLAKLGKKRV